jgi:hypothetical protein
VSISLGNLKFNIAAGFFHCFPVRVPGYRSGGPGSIPVLPGFLRSSGSGMGPLGKNSSGSGLEN